VNVDLTSFLVPRWLPERTKAVKYYISFDEDASKMTPDEFWEFSRQNPNMRAELTKDGEVTLMSPTGFESSYENSQINFQLTSWANKNGNGMATESNGGYILPNGATYAPDAAWTQRSRLEKFTKAERKRFLPLCPDFVIELLSFSDKLAEQQAKMEEYIENGLRLGWLIDPYRNTVHIYRPGREPEILDSPKSVSGEDVLPGFELDLTKIW